MAEWRDTVSGDLAPIRRQARGDEDSFTPEDALTNILIGTLVPVGPTVRLRTPSGRVFRAPFNLDDWRRSGTLPAAEEDEDTPLADLPVAARRYAAGVRAGTADMAAQERLVEQAEQIEREVRETPPAPPPEPTEAERAARTDTVFRMAKHRESTTGDELSHADIADLAAERTGEGFESTDVNRVFDRLEAERGIRQRRAERGAAIEAAREPPPPTVIPTPGRAVRREIPTPPLTVAGETIQVEDHREADRVFGAIMAGGVGALESIVPVAPSLMLRASAALYGRAGEEALNLIMKEHGTARMIGGVAGAFAPGSIVGQIAAARMPTALSRAIVGSGRAARIGRGAIRGMEAVASGATVGGALGGAFGLSESLLQDRDLGQSIAESVLAGAVIGSAFGVGAEMLFGAGRLAYRLLVGPGGTSRRLARSFKPSAGMLRETPRSSFARVEAIRPAEREVAGLRIDVPLDDAKVALTADLLDGIVEAGLRDGLIHRTARRTLEAATVRRNEMAERLPAEMGRLDRLRAARGARRARERPSPQVETPADDPLVKIAEDARAVVDEFSAQLARTADPTPERVTNSVRIVNELIDAMEGADAPGRIEDITRRLGGMDDAIVLNIERGQAATTQMLRDVRDATRVPLHARFGSNAWRMAQRYSSAQLIRELAAESIARVGEAPAFSLGRAAGGLVVGQIASRVMPGPEWLKDLVGVGGLGLGLRPVQLYRFLRGGMGAGVMPMMRRTAALAEHRLRQAVQLGREARRQNDNWADATRQYLGFQPVRGAVLRGALPVTEPAETPITDDDTIEAIERVEDIKREPHGFLRRVQDLGDLPGQLDAQVGSLFAATAVRAATFLVSKLPDRTSIDPLTPQPGPPAPDRLDDFRVYWEAVVRTDRVQRRMARGDLDDRSVEAIRAVYPATYRRIVQDVWQTVAPADMPYDTRMRLSVLLGQPTDWSMTGEGLAFLQAAHLGHRGHRGLRGHRGERVERQDRSQPRPPKSYETESQRVQSGTT